MTFELSEDILEAILNTGKETVKVSNLEDMAHGDTDKFSKALTCLKDKGYVTESAKGLSLTDKGAVKAAQVARKHAVLTSFLTDVLGTEPDHASKEACQMEHSISTETIDRLDTFLENRGPGHKPGHGRTWGRRAARTEHPVMQEHEGHAGLTKRNPIVSLSECEEGSLLHVSMIRCFGKHSRLIDLGVIPGELITLRRKLDNHAVVITVKGCDIALSPEVAENIMVERCNTQ
ncbi:iron dependent repressor [Methanocorpusculum labreanum Z]|uniref:Iron dependent repressor n=1 Tax=Methanocorpusculum labreanum (strain ATCC 43576 / DSM 4855 / Z) TaxID=410358 RepID=A2SQF4_METLZ|nr:metal-dependent transcriptional regulator [Methanocorpusculum labreanum]ABN06560.1 iron dependent repressor [Methanocorpusculum labreanum Z]